MEIEFVGGAQTVTGSKHVVTTARARVLLDCGLFQGRRRESIEINQHLGVGTQLDAVVLSHAHIDHSGALPLLVKTGFTGPIYATPATRDLCAAMLMDAALIQDADARYVNKLIDRGESSIDRVTPLYDRADVSRTLSQMVGIPYHQRHTIARGVDLTFLDAGHVLGSAVTVLDIDEGNGPRRLAFTGDLGRPHAPLLREPEVPSGVEVLLTESTYGDRVHRPIAEMTGALGEAIARVVRRGGKVVIPSFALERAQEILFALGTLRRAGKLPKLPVYVDSPLTIQVTDVFRLHPECLDPETQRLLAGDSSPFEFESLHYVSTTEDSKAIDREDGPAVIVSASGMCEAGRVLHHLRATIGSDKNMVIIVGFQAQHTLGRRILERRPRVRIFGVDRDLRAEVIELGGFSAHADQPELLKYVGAVASRGSVGRVFLVHGEPPAQRSLAALLARQGIAAHAPAPGERITL